MRLVLASPKHGNHVDVVVNWKFKLGCEALVVVVRTALSSEKLSQSGAVKMVEQ